MISLKDVHVAIPVFLNNYSKALRTVIGEKLFGGRLSAANGGKVIVNALRGVTLTVQPGERVGLLGRNGAGKTTMLRAIAGVVPISQGSIEVDGEIRSFFNLSAGLDPTRSGLANIEGISMFYTRDRARIRATVPDIVAFADLGDFIHMPVYSYSAGMQARLLVAIATSYGGDVLIFDEMLGAGDANFIGRVEERLSDMMKSARCVVVASHSTDLIKRLCTRAIWLEQGLVRMDGSTDEVIAAYGAAGG